MKILIIGNGQLGSCAYKILSEKKDKYEIKISGIEGDFDFKYDLINGNLEKVLGDYLPEVIILTAAYTHVDGCEEKPNLSFAINVKGTENIVKFCKTHQVKLIFFSTDYIFDGNHGPYSEDDSPNPLNVYGQHKLNAEKIIKENLKNYLILRIAWLADIKYDNMNFVARLLEKLKNRESLKIVDDQYGNPTLTRNVVENIEVFLDQNLSGTYHISGTEMINRFAYARKIAEIFGYDPNLILKAKSNDFKTAAKRPLYGGMNTAKAKKIPGIKLLNVEEMVYKMKDDIAF